MKSDELTKLVREEILKEFGTVDFKAFFDEDLKEKKQKANELAKKLIALYKTDKNAFATFDEESDDDFINKHKSRNAFGVMKGRANMGAFKIKMSDAGTDDMIVVKGVDSFPGSKPHIMTYMGDDKNYYPGFHTLMGVFDYINKKVNRKQK